MSQKMSKLEERAIKLLLEHESAGILQSDLWHMLEVTSREGSRIAIKLENKGMVKRVKEFANDRWTRRLVPLVRRIEVGALKGCPCPACERNDVCRSTGTVRPVTCLTLERWVLDSCPEEMAKDQDELPLEAEK